MEGFFRYYGTDWVGMTFGLLSAYHLSKKERSGFVFAAIAGLGWLAFGVITGSLPSIVANLLFITFNFRGFLRWNKPEPQSE